MQKSNTTKQGPEPDVFEGSTFVPCSVAPAHEMPRPSVGHSPHVNTAVRETAGGGPRSFERRHAE